MEKHRYQQITEGVIWKALLLYAIPIFLQSTFQQVFGIADAIIVGQAVGKEALGSINSTSNLIRLFLNLFLGMCSGVSILIGQYWGAKDYRHAEDTVHTGLAFSFLIGAVTAIGCVAATPIFMRIMQIPEDMLPYSAGYTRIVFIGFVGLFIYDMGAAILRAIGDSRRPFYYLIFSLALNVVLDLVLVVFLKLGVEGAAVATSISQAVSAVMVLVYMMSDASPIKVMIRKIRVIPSEFIDLLKVGVPLGIHGALYSISNITIQSTVNALGTDMITGWGIHVKVDSIIWSLYDALRISCSTFVAQNYGAKNAGRVKETVRTSLVMGLFIIGSASALIFVLIRPLSGIFISDPSVIDYAAYISRFMAPFYFLYLFGEIFTATIRGCKETFVPMIITLIGTCGFRVLWVAMIYRFGGPTVFNVTLGYPASWFVYSAMVTIYYFFGRWRRRLKFETA